MSNDTSLLEYAAALAEEIGPRPATSEQEYQASEWIAGEFEHRGLDTHVQNFRAPKTFAGAAVVYGALSILGAILAGLAGWPRIIALILALASAVIFYLDYEMIWGFSTIFARRHSQNVVARHVPRGTRGERVRKIVLVAHYDSPQSSLASTPALANNTSIIFAINKWCTWLMPVLILLQILLKPAIASWVWYITLVLAAYLLFLLIVNLLSLVAGKGTDGANGNASGIATLLGVADNLMSPSEEPAQEEDAEDDFARPMQHAPKSRIVAEPVLYGREAIEAAGIAPSEATIEYAAEARAAAPKASATGTFARIDGTGKIPAIANEEPAKTEPAGADTPEPAPAEPTPEPIAAEPVAEIATTPPMLTELPEEGFPAGLTIDTPPAPIEAAEPQEAPLPAAEAAELDPAPAPIEQTLPGAEPLRAEIPAIDDIALPGETRAFTPVGTSSVTGPLEAVPAVIPSMKEDVVDLDAMLAPKEPIAPEPVYERDEGWEGDMTEEFAAIPDSRIREFGSQVTGMFAKIVPGKKKNKIEDEEEALGSWLHSGKKKRGSKKGNDAWTGDDDDDYGWSGGATPIAGDEDIDIKDRLERIKEEVFSVADRDLLDKEVWFVATGASTSGAWGMRSFLHEYESEFKGALIIVIDSVGAGELSWITREGTVRPRKADRRVFSLGKRVARGETIGIHTEKISGFWTDGTAALIKKQNALTLMGIEGRMPAHWCSADDVVDELNADVLADAATLVTGMIRES